MSLTEKPEDLNVPAANNNVTDISLDGIERSRFRINGNPESIIELNLSDLSILERLEKGIEKLEREIEQITQLPDEGEEGLSEKLKQADQRMRDCVDYIFDYPVSAVCAKNGTMYDPINGQFRYEIIIDGLTKLYTNNINSEYKKFSARIKKHTEKYTGSKGSKNKGKKNT